MWLGMSVFPSNGYMPSSSPNKDQPFLPPLAPPLSKPNASPKPFTLQNYFPYPSLPSVVELNSAIFI